MATKFVIEEEPELNFDDDDWGEMDTAPVQPTTTSHPARPQPVNTAPSPSSFQPDEPQRSYGDTIYNFSSRYIPESVMQRVRTPNPSTDYERFMYIKAASKLVTFAGVGLLVLGALLTTIYGKYIMALGIITAILALYTVYRPQHLFLKIATMASGFDVVVSVIYFSLADTDPKDALMVFALFIIILAKIVLTWLLYRYWCLVPADSNFFSKFDTPANRAEVDLDDTLVI